MGRKVKVETLARELDADPEEVARLAVEKLPEDMVSRARDSTRNQTAVYVDRDALDTIREALTAEELVPKQYRGKVARKAPNRSYVYTHIPEIGKVVPTLIPRRYYDTLDGKRITVEAITDENGTSYRWIRDRTDA